MLKKPGILVFLTIGLVFQAFPIHSFTVYSTGLNVKKKDKSVLIEWKANTNRFSFWIYRGTNGPISLPSELTNAVKIATLELEGKPDRDLFKFPPYQDTIGTLGQYYYIVLPAKTGWTSDDFNPNLNFTISPVTFKAAEPVAGIPDTEPTETLEEDGVEDTATPAPSGLPVSRPENLNPESVLGIFIRTNMGVFQVFWDAGPEGPAEAGKKISKSFYIYRTTNFVSNVTQFARLKPYKIVRDDYVLEDTDVRFGVTYFYTILVNDYKIILPGVNENLSPAFWGSTNERDIRVEREIFLREKVNTRSYRNRFAK